MKFRQEGKRAWWNFPREGGSTMSPQLHKLLSKSFVEAQLFEKGEIRLSRLEKESSGLWTPF